MNSNSFKQFSRGFFYPFRAGRFLRKNISLIKYIAIPFFINLTVFSLAVFYGFSIFNDFITKHIPNGDAWYWIILSYALWVVGIAITAVLIFFTFTVVGNLIASPFNELLSERTEEILTGQPRNEGFSFRQFLKDSLRTLKEEGKKMSIFIFGMLLLLTLTLVPVVGAVIYAVSSLLFTLFFLSIEYTGYVFGRYRWSFKAQRQFVFKRKFLMIGFGFGILLLLFIPFVQFLCIPLGVIGATQLWWDDQERGGA